jgi:hypothetical protein
VYGRTRKGLTFTSISLLASEPLQTENVYMKKITISGHSVESSSNPQEEWLDLEAIARAEVTSEDPNFPIESAITAKARCGWRAAETGEQVIRLVFDRPTPLHRIRLEFSETEVERTQEFTLRWAPTGEALREIVRQQWNFSPLGSTSEVEDYRVDLDRVSIIELRLKPDLRPDHGLATLAAWRLA